MLKLLRKYNKIILAVGGALLMVVFLLPSGFQQMANQPSNATIAKIDGHTVTEGELAQAELELNAIKKLDEWVQGRGLPFSLVQSTFAITSGSQEREHWWLLTHEAERGGFVGGDADASRFLENVGRELVAMIRRFVGELPPDFEAVTLAQMQQLPELIARTPADLERVITAFAKAHGVMRMIEEHAAAVRVSSPEAIAIGRSMFDRATVSFAMLDPAINLEGVPQPSEEAVRAQFEQYREVLATSNDRGFGYRTPAAVKIEFLRISRAALEGALKPDPVAVRTLWQREKARYGDDFASARPRVEAEIRRRAVDAAMAEAEQFVRTEVLKGERGLESDGRYKKLPADWAQRRPALDAINRALFDFLREKRGITAQVAMSQMRTAWIAREAIERDPDLSRLTVSVGGKNIPFAEAAFGIPEIDPASTSPLQAGLIFGPYRTASGDVFFVRIFDARPSTPAEDLELVRGQVTADLMRLAAYEAVAAKTDELAASAAQDFVRFAAGYNAPVQSGAVLNEGGMSLASGAPADRDINNATVRKAVMDRARSIDPSKPIEEIRMERRIVVVPLPDFLRVAVVRIDEVRPLSLEEYRVNAASLAESPAADLGRGGFAAFTIDALKQRHNFRYEGLGKRMEEEAARRRAASAAAGAGAS